MMLLPDNEYREIVRSTPLVALDLLVSDPSGRVLLGLRRNSPARGFLFVPGGRVLKGESLADSLLRISCAELGFPLDPSSARLQGVYDHFYCDSFFEEPGLSTHYVVIACAFVFPEGAVPRAGDQHFEFETLSLQEIRDNPRVHPYTRNYFLGAASGRFLATGGGLA